MTLKPELGIFLSDISSPAVTHHLMRVFLREYAFDRSFKSIDSPGVSAFQASIISFQSLGFLGWTCQEVDLSSRNYFYIMFGRRMSLTFSFKRRSSLAICLAVLKAAKNGVKKTRLLSSASSSYEQLIRYVGFLKASGLIEEHSHSYQTTDKGLELIEEYESSSLIRAVAPA